MRLTIVALVVAIVLGNVGLGAGMSRVYLPSRSTHSRNSCLRCNKAAPLKKEYCPACQKEIERMEKERREKAKELRQQITVDKYDSPEGLRIRELCGYELGSVIKLP